MLKALLLNLSRLSITFKNFAPKAVIAALALMMLVSLSCGKRRAPLPPVERVSQRTEVSAYQRGNQVIISWKMPARNAADGSVLNINRADIYRLAEPLDSPLTISEEEFASRSVIVASVPITDADFALKTLSYTDALEFSGQAARLRYAIRLVNSSGQKAGFSNFVVVEPAGNIASAPTSLSLDLSQDAISLNWTGPAANVDNSTPANLIGYNVYRSTAKDQPGRLLNKTPITDDEYRDEFFEFGTEYWYFVRAVSVGNGGPVESRESNIVNIKPVDTFPPSPPAAITLASSPTTISIFFAVNPEKDIAGYRIYRSIDANADPASWTLLTPEPITTNTYQDTKVESGSTYYYYLTATDTAGNTSRRSEIVSEKVQ